MVIVGVSPGRPRDPRAALKDAHYMVRNSWGPNVHYEVSQPSLETPFSANKGQQV